MKRSSRLKRSKEYRDKVERPLRERELLKSLPARDPIGGVDSEIEFDIPIAAEETPEVQVRLHKVTSEHTMIKGIQDYRLQLLVHKDKFGVHSFPPRPQVKKIVPSASIKKLQEEFVTYSGNMPDHLPFRPIPQRLPKELEAKPRIQVPLAKKRQKDIQEPTTIFPPDNRYTFNDTAYPWCTVGRVDTPGGSASGVMVGPRHLLTCSHAIQWRSDGTAGWVRFTPSYFDSSAPFGIAWGEWVYFERNVDSSNGIDRDEGQHDYVAVVLNRRMGNLTGWMGGKSWSDDWDDEPYWRHIYYPGDLASGERPSYQRDIPLDGSFWDREVHTRIWHQGDVWPGQSGGPFFAWWSGESWPSVVAVQSGQNSDENSGSGGAHMIDLIMRARDEHP
jgi:V8-like Glu-specific endopeptidase